MRKIFSSLTVKIGTIVILIEILALSMIGFYYITQFSIEIDRALENQIQIPGTLMTQGLLNFEAVGDKKVLEELIGETVLDAFVVGSNQKIFYSLNPEYVGRTVAEIPELAQVGQFDETMMGGITEVADGLVSVRPIRLEGDKLIGFLYVKVGAEKQETQKRFIITTFVLGSVVCVILTSIAIVVLFYSMISVRINKLLNVLRRVKAGDLGARIEGSISSDQMGVLQDDVNSMANQLQQTIGTLEIQVAERTRRLETMVEISQRLTSILDLSELLREVVTLTKETFGYYHVHIYLLDEENQTLIMTEGYGEAGAQMKRQRHNIPLATAQSLVVRAFRERRVITVEDTLNDPTWLPNPLLPDTRSEMAVPVMSGQKVMGVLDVQSERIGGLTLEDETMLQTLANQIFVAARNARTFSQTQAALRETQELRRLYTGDAWKKLGAVKSTTDYEVRQPDLPSLQNITTPEAITALQHKQTVDLRIGGSGGDGADLSPTGSPEEAQDNSAQVESQAIFESALATPLKLGEDIIGVLGIRDDDPDRRWTEEEIALIEAVSEQMSLALENARLFEETGRRASRERIIAEMTRQVWASGEMEQVMRTAVEQLGQTLDASRVIIRLGTEEQLITLPPEPDDGTEFPD